MAIPTRLAPIGRKWRKPYGSEVEYLASTGTQYIRFNEDFYGASVTVSNVGANNDCGIVGSYNGSSQGNTIGFSTTSDDGVRRGWFVKSNGGAYVRSYSNTQTARTTVAIVGTNVTINGSGYTIATAWNYGGVQHISGFALFGCNRNNNNTVTCRVGKIYHCALYNSNGDMVRDLVPVVKSGIGYMYDRLSGRLFGNDGTGEFVIGPIRATQEES